MRRFLIVSAFALFCASTTFGAVDVGGTPLYVSATGSWGYSSTTVAAGNSSPTLMQYGLGVTGAYPFGEMWMAGISTDFTFINQFSDTTASGANYRGTRWNIVAPTVGAKIGSITLLADFQFLGNYKLYKSSASGADVSYKSPLGGRIRGTYPVMEKVSLGAQFEYLRFSKLGNSATGDTDLATSQKLWQAGLIAGYAF